MLNDGRQMMRVLGQQPSWKVAEKSAGMSIVGSLTHGVASGRNRQQFFTFTWEKVRFYLMTHSVHFIYGFWQKQTAVLHIHLGKGEVLFNDTLGTFYLWLPAKTGSSSSHSPGKRIGFI